MASTVQRRGRKVALGVRLLGLAMLSVLALGLAVPLQVRASGIPGRLTFTPLSGSAGSTVVQVTITPPQALQGPTTYTLYVTTTNPSPDTMGNCPADTIQPIPGVAPFTVGTDGGGTQFTWPTSLDQGPYWLCANTSPSYLGVYSTDQFTAYAPGVPVPTATPGATTGTVIANVPAHGARAGSSITVSVTNWFSPSGTPPRSVVFTAINPSDLAPGSQIADLGPSAPFTTDQGTTSGAYTLTVTVPQNLASGIYWVVVSDGSGSVYSKNMFNVIPAPVPTTAPTPVTPVPPGASNTNTAPSLLVVGMLLMLAIIALVAFLLRRVQVRQRREEQAREEEQRARQRFEQQMDEQRLRDERFGGQWPGGQGARGQWQGTQQSWGDEQQPWPDGSSQWPREQQRAQQQPQWPQPQQGQPWSGDQHQWQQSDYQRQREPQYPREQQWGQQEQQWPPRDQRYPREQAPSPTHSRPQNHPHDQRRPRQ